LRNQVEAATSGDNQHRLMVLEEGLKYEKTAFTPNDTQMLQTREFQAEEICRFYKVTPVMVGLTSKSTSWGSGIAELSQGFVTYTLMPWLVRWQQVFSKDLILASEKYFVEFLTDALLRGDIEKRYKAYAIGRNWGWLATNEIRRAENMNPKKDGDDDYLVPGNMSEQGAGNRDEGTGMGEPVPGKKQKAAPGLEEDGGQDGQDGQDGQAQGQPQRPPQHYQRLVRESAGRVARKEAAALRRTAGKPGDTWRDEVEGFFESHADFVSQAMCISVETAQVYVDIGLKRLILNGREALEGWEQTRAAELAALTMGVEEA
jgi:hypothetical protein